VNDLRWRERSLSRASETLTDDWSFHPLSRRVKDAGTPQEEGKHMDYLHSDTQADPKHDL